MLSRFESIIINDFNAFKGKEIFLAISGGKDSMTLSHLLLQLGYSHTLLHCNFQLRPTDSDLDEQFILDYAKRNNLPAFIEKFNTAEQAIELGLTIQETARKLRYDWFKTFTKNNNQKLLTAHHQSDSVETFFINLMRGTGIKGLAGIPKTTGNIVRPLLPFSSEEISTYSSNNKIDFRQDLSNFDNKYLRNELRNKLIPQFEAKSPKFSQKVASTIDSLNDLTHWVEKQATLFKQKHFSKNNNLITAKLSSLFTEDTAFLEFIFKEYGIHRSNLLSYSNFIHAKTGAQFLTETHLFAINRSDLHIIPNAVSKQNRIEIIENNLPFELNSGFNHLTLSKTTNALPFSPNESIQQLNFNKVKFPITIRNWQNGDKIQPLGMSGTKLISDILINKKIPQLQKNNTLLLQDNDKNILAIIGIQISDLFKIQQPTKYILLIKIH